MELTVKQQQGLKIALNKFHNGDKYVTIAGYAGTGKSTLVRFIIEAIDIDPSKVAYACFTGKAAEVLRKKGNSNAITTHKLLYDSFPRQGGGFYRKPKETLDYSVIVIDEVSMLPKKMLDLLLSHRNIFVIFLGDHFQLPQIDKNESHDILDHPDIFLDEVMRQAAESEIIQLTMKIRNMEDIDFYKGNEVMIIPKQELVTGHLIWADQIICGTNKVRINVNNQMRELLGFSGAPQDGEKMICLRNYWEDLSTDGNFALVNGITGILENPFESFQMAPSYIKMKNHRMDTVVSNFKTDDGTYFTNVAMDKHMIETGEKCISWKESFALGKLVNKIGDIVPREFTYGYAITCHKAQGSEWDKVLVLEERFPFDKVEHARWLYTAVSRSAEKLVLAR